MDIITTSLEALIQRATSVNNQCPDNAAIDAFCGLVNKEPDSVQVASKLIISKVHSLQEWEAQQALLLLETCIARCGDLFLSEVGKFRFLNELIKLVSPKYLGTHTSEAVKRRVIELMNIWTQQYPKEIKIKEAFDMLRKQGVVKEEYIPPIPAKDQQQQKSHSILENEENAQLLQKLLQSKKPQDLRKANSLIKTMVREEDTILRYKAELETIMNNCKLLKEMLDNFDANTSKYTDLELIKELYTTCKNLRQGIVQMAINSSLLTSENTFYVDILYANEELDKVINKYNEVIQTVNSSSLNNSPRSNEVNQSKQCESLLDLSPNKKNSLTSNDLATLDNNTCDGNLNGNVTTIESLSLLTLDDILCSTSEKTNKVSNVQDLKPLQATKNKGLEELDILGESLLKESLSKSGNYNVMLNKMNDKTPMNQLNVEFKESKECKDDLLSLEPCSTNTIETNLLLVDVPILITGTNALSNFENKLEIQDTSLIDKFMSAVKDDKLLNSPNKQENNKSNDGEPIRILSLADIDLTINDITPCSIPPFNALTQENGVSVDIFLAKDCPKSDVSVFVITTTSKCISPISNFLFQPVVPKTCRLRLLSSSQTSLPGFKPFLPISAITQIMLIASLDKKPILLKFVISYSRNDETITEMGEIEDLILLDES